MIRLQSSKPLLPASIILEAGQYYTAACHLPSMKRHRRMDIIKISESLIKTSLAEVLMCSTEYDDDSLIALQLVSFFQVSGSLSLPLLAASTKAARLALLSSPKAVHKKLIWCSACVWEACIALGMQSGIELFKPEDVPNLLFLDELAPLTDVADRGVRCVLLRARNLAHVSKAWKRFPEEANNISNILAEWSEAWDVMLSSVEGLGEFW